MMAELSNIAVLVLGSSMYGTCIRNTAAYETVGSFPPVKCTNLEDTPSVEEDLPLGRSPRRGPVDVRDLELVQPLPDHHREGARLVALLLVGGDPTDSPTGRCKRHAGAHTAGAHSAEVGPLTQNSIGLVSLVTLFGRLWWPSLARDIIARPQLRVVSGPSRSPRGTWPSPYSCNGAAEQPFGQAGRSS